MRVIHNVTGIFGTRQENLGHGWVRVLWDGQERSSEVLWEHLHFEREHERWVLLTDACRKRQLEAKARAEGLEELAQAFALQASDREEAARALRGGHGR